MQISTVACRSGDACMLDVQDQHAASQLCVFTCSHRLQLPSTSERRLQSHCGERRKKWCYHFSKKKNLLLCPSEAWHHMRGIVGRFFFFFFPPATVGLGWGDGGGRGAGSRLPRGVAIHSVLFLDLGLSFGDRNQPINCPIFVTQILC